MIISHKHKFIFLKTNKTAGTSVEIALSKFCGPDDVITPITPEDEQTRLDMGFRGAQNYMLPKSQYKLKNYLRLWTQGVEKRVFFNHMTAAEAMEHIDPEVWDSYYKFCFTRNPWDRFVSMYYWKCRKAPGTTMQEFLASKTANLMVRRGFGLYSIDGKVVVDRVCRFENLAEELQSVLDHLGIEGELELPRAKSQFKKDKRSYREILGEKERDIIADMCKEEIEMFGYEF